MSHTSYSSTAGRILVIDDDQQIRRTIADYLIDSGFLVLQAEDGASGLELFEEERPDLVLLDLHMPRMDGMTVVERLANLSPGTPVVLLLGGGVMKDAVMALRQGAWDFITKPITDMAILEHALKTALERAELLADRQRRNEVLEHEVKQRTQELRREIMEHIRTSQALINSEAKYRAIMERASDAFIILDERLDIMDVNPRASELTGHPPSHLAAMSWADLFAPDFDCVTNLRQALATGNDLIMEAAMPVRDGSTRMVEFSAAQIESGRCLVILRDITERRIIQAESMRADQLASIGELASSVAHEINNPLNAVINYAQIILDSTGAESDTADMARRMLKESDRIASIVRNLLSFSRYGDSPPTPLSPTEILEDSITLFKAQLKKDNISLTIEADHEPALCLVKPNEIRQVFVNLLSNARYALNSKFPAHSPEKRLRIAMEHLPARPDTGDPSPGFVRILFLDNGPGIPDDIMDKITQPFFTTKPPREGTGLGLSICRDIVQRHGGRLWFASTPGQETTAAVELPVWDHASEQPASLPAGGDAHPAEG